jgi:RHS repeat-associated protein
VEQRKIKAKSSGWDVVKFNYDSFGNPETGRFMSYDPIELIDMEPESSNPYQFVYNNPHVYSDPTGMFSIIELNTTLNLQDTLRSIAGEQVRQYLQ